MNADKYVSLQDVRRNPELLKLFIKQHPSKADKERFENLLKHVADDTLPNELLGGRDDTPDNNAGKARPTGGRRK